MGPRDGVPHLRVSGWGVSGVSGFGDRVRIRGVSLFFCGGRGVGLFLAPPGLFPVPLGLLGGGAEEVPSHLVEGSATRVFHPNGTNLLPMDTADGALLYPGGVGDVGNRLDNRIVGTVVLLLGRCTPNLGGDGLGRGGLGGGGLGGSVGSGAATAFVGRAIGVGAGGLGFLPRGFAASSLFDPDSEEKLHFF